MSNAPAFLLSPSVLEDFSEGQKLGGVYILRRKVDCGPCEPVWLAFDEVLGKDVWLDFVPPLVRDDAPAMEALRHGIKCTRQLIHPNILRVYGLIEEDNWAAISMEAVEADSLATVLRTSRDGFLEPSEVRGWLEQLCQTLQDTHKIQLVHQDLSPRNLFVDARGKLLITGFGFSRILKDALARLQSASGIESGLAYASPQQRDGERPSSADDIYAAGALLHEVLAGEPPFAGSDIVPQMRRMTPASIAERRGKRKKDAEAISPEWEKLAAACLAKSPDQRPKSMAEIASAIAGIDLPGNATATPTQSGETRSRDLDERRVAPLARPIESVPFSEHPAANKTETTRIKPVEPLAAKVKPAEARKAIEEGLKQMPADSKSRKARVSPEMPTASSAPLPRTERVRELDQAAVLENAIPDHYPSFGPPGHSFAVTWIAAAAILLGIGIYGVFFSNLPSADKQAADSVFAAEETEHGSELTAVKNLAENQLVSESAFDSSDPAGVRTSVQGDAGEGPTADAGETDLIAANAAPRSGKSSPPARKNSVATPAPARPAEISAAVADPSIAAKAAALEKAQQVAEAAEQARQGMMKQQNEAEAAVVEARNRLEAKTKTAAPILKAAEEVENARKKQEEEMRAAEVESQKAQQIAIEKARTAEEAKKSLAAFQTENKEKITAQQNVDAELKELRKVVEERQRLAEETRRAAEEAGARIAEQKLAVRKSEQELADARMSVQKAAEEAARLAAERRRNLESELEATRKMFKEKMEALEKALQETQSPSVPPPPSTSGAPTTKSEAAPPPVADQSSGAAAVPSPPSLSAADVNKPEAETTLAMKTEPLKPGASTPSASAGDKTGVAQDGYQNSLGMRFAPVGDVLFSVWQTRVQDFEVFAKATGLKSNLWKDPGFKQGLTHPVVNISWTEAVAFCKWLTVKEQKEGLIAANQQYRLPHDLEWSRAVGLPDETGKTPEERDMGVVDIYPWGTQWPPPPGAGNYTGEETGSDAAIKGYDDGFAWTSPVGSFKPNKFGLSDMGGNVWQWCMDSWNKEQKAKVLRGSSWYNGAIRFSLLSSCRVHAAPDSSTDNYGFRCVIATGESRRSRR